MTAPEASAGLLVLVADGLMKQAIEILLEKRRRALGIRETRFRVLRHHEADPGCRMNSVEIVRPHLRSAERLLVLFDYEGCGSSEAPEKVERSVEADLARNGWKDRSKVIVIVPELETWVWGPSEGAMRALGWRAGFPALRSDLARTGLWPPGDSKPPDPKKAAEWVLRRRRKSLDAGFYRALAAGANFRDCRDPAFCALRDTLREWYPAEDAAPKES